MTDTRTPLDGFEQRLLTELRAEVRSAPELVARPAARRRRRLALAGTAALAVGAAAAVGGPILLGDHAPAKAFAVDRSADGTVRVEIFRYADAAGLERKLADYGVHADVQYAPPGKGCRMPRYTPLDVDLPASALVIDLTPADGAALAVTVSPPALSGMTLVIGLSEMPIHDVGPNGAPGTGLTSGIARGVGVGVADGPVAPCVLVDLPLRGSSK